MHLNRREWTATVFGSLARGQAAATAPVIDTHIHLFEPERFPYHANAVYRPPAQSLAEYAAFVKGSDITHTILVHPEPYQEDHRYLEYCFAHEPRPGFFKGTCLYDPLAPDTPARIKGVSARIVALRVHATEPDKYPTRSGPIRDRDLASPEMRRAWKAAADRGIAVQLHLIPKFAPPVYKLAEQFPGMPVLLDHMARAAQGTEAEYGEVLRLAKLPRVYIKFSGPGFTLRPDWVRRAFDAFGPERMMWGGLGHSGAEYAKARAIFEQAFAFTTEKNRELIQGRNAAKLFGF
jgi:predicted TIM-barrel fold metal-dependent hydrolase